MSAPVPLASRRGPICSSRRSPAWWPRASFSSLKVSRSSSIRGKRGAAALGLGDQDLEAPKKPASVREPREVVGLGLQAQGARSQGHRRKGEQQPREGEHGDRARPEAPEDRCGGCPRGGHHQPVVGVAHLPADRRRGCPSAPERDDPRLGIGTRQTGEASLARRPQRRPDPLGAIAVDHYRAVRRSTTVIRKRCVWTAAARRKLSMVTSKWTMARARRTPGARVTFAMTHSFVSGETYGRA